ncbi:MAG: hypothetical protein A2173_08170 [Planctomycetes bacterium RBG_13_44_8b]|nr:MAG: hypothetical protein A2173_08170 [Planctomycetes bacterium RBG_13_44_8b]
MAHVQTALWGYWFTAITYAVTIFITVYSGLLSLKKSQKGLSFRRMKLLPFAGFAHSYPMSKSFFIFSSDKRTKPHFFGAFVFFWSIENG